MIRPWVVGVAALAAGPLVLAATVAAGTLAPVPPVRDDLSASDLERVRAVTRPAKDFAGPEPFEPMQGGATTTATVGREAFSQFAANLPFAGQQSFKVGNGLFRKLWVSAPSSTRSSDGLGPLFNSRACQSCHVKDGRGHAAGAAGSNTFLMRLSVPTVDGGDAPEPTYGGQLQDVAVAGLPAEGTIGVTWTEQPVTLADGTVVRLRKPDYTITGLGYGPMRGDVRLSPRVASPMIGLGLLEVIDAGDILSHADPEDADHDGISGRPNMVIDDRTGETVLGRFGWKAGQPTIEQQTAHAFSGDMGLSTPLMTAAAGDCTGAQASCLAMPAGDDQETGEPEVPQDVLDLVTFYARTLAVPARRNVGDAEVLRGKALFHAAGCPACHVPKYVTRRDATVEALRFQLIWPHTDLLLHDMGEGLADGRPEAGATGREWRTPPLWGLGLTRDVAGHGELLHDGRARNPLEAILWHGGEAAATRDRVAAMKAGEREALLAFLQSL